MNNVKNNKQKFSRLRIASWIISNDKTKNWKKIMSRDIEFSKPQLSKIIQSGAFLGALLLKLAGPLIESWCSFS